MKYSGNRQITVSNADLSIDGVVVGATLSLNDTDSVGTYVIYGTAVLSSSLTIQGTGSPVIGLNAIFYFSGNVTLGVNTFTFFGVSVPQAYLTPPGIWMAFYDGSSYYGVILPSFAVNDIVTTDRIANLAVTNAKIDTGIDGNKITAGTIPASALSAGLQLANTQLAQMPANTIKGNDTGSPATPSDLTVSQTKTLLGVAMIEPGAGAGSIKQARTVNPTIALGVDAFAYGEGATANGTSGIAFGEGCQATGNYSQAFGRDARSTRTAQFSRNSANQTFINNKLFLDGSIATTDATPTVMLIAGPGGSPVNIINNTIMSFDVQVTAHQSGGVSGSIGDCAMWKFSGLIRNLGGVVSMVDESRFEAEQTIVVRETGTAQAGGPSNITLQASASSDFNIFVGAKIYIISGTGSGQTREISAYNGTTKVATVASAWGTQPDNTSVYRIVTQQSYVANAIMWDVQVSANVGLQTLEFIVTGEVNKNLSWTFDLRGIEAQFS